MITVALGIRVVCAIAAFWVWLAATQHEGVAGLGGYAFAAGLAAVAIGLIP